MRCRSAGASSAFAWLTFQFRRSVGDRFWRGLQGAMAAATACLLAVLLVGQSSWVRYQVYRWELFGNHFGFTAYDQAGTEQQLVWKLGRTGIGGWLQRDAEVLRHLATNCGDLFAQEPEVAKTSLTSLQACGVSLSDCLADRDADAFLLYALAGEMFADVPERQWSDSQTSLFLNRKVAEIDSLSRKELEALVVCIGLRSELVEKAQREKVLSAWLQSVPEFAGLLRDEIQLGRMLNEAFEDQGVDSIRLVTQEGHRLPYQATQDRLSLVINRSLETLINLTGDKPVIWKQQDADLEITISLDSLVLEEYQVPATELRSVYVPGRTQRYGRQRRYRTGRTELQLVKTGGSETRRVFGTTVALDLAFQSDPFGIAETLAYWTDHFRDRKDVTLDASVQRELYGRVWPLGIHRAYFSTNDESDQ